MDSEQVFYKHYGNPFHSTFGSTLGANPQVRSPQHTSRNTTRRENYTAFSRMRDTRTDQMNVTEMQSVFKQRTVKVQGDTDERRPDSPLTACIRKVQQKKSGAGARARTEDKSRQENHLPPMTEEQKRDYDRKMYWKTL